MTKSLSRREGLVRQVEGAEQDLWERRLEALEERRRQAIRSTFQRLDGVALGVAVGVVLGLVCLLVTAVYHLKGVALGSVVGDISIFIPGFRTTWGGAFLLAGYGLALGFCLGMAVAFFRNSGLRIVLWWALWKADRFRRRNLLDLV